MGQERERGREEEGWCSHGSIGGQEFSGWNLLFGTTYEWCGFESGRNCIWYTFKGKSSSLSLDREMTRADQDEETLTASSRWYSSILDGEGRDWSMSSTHIWLLTSVILLFYSLALYSSLTKLLNSRLPQGSPSLLALPLHSGLSTEAQLAAFEPPPRSTRKVVVSTNVAEASITIEGIKFVIDSGLVKVSFLPFSPFSPFSN